MAPLHGWMPAASPRYVTRCVLSDYAHGCACVADCPYTRCIDSLIMSMGSSMLCKVEEEIHH